MKKTYVWENICKYGRKSIFFKNFILILLIIMLPFSMFGFGFLTYYSKNIRQEVSSYAQNSNKRVLDDMENLALLLRNSYSMIASDETLLYYLSGVSYTDTNEMINDIRDIESTLRMVMCNIPMIESVYIYNIKQEYVLGTNMSAAMEKFEDKSWYYLYERNNRAEYFIKRDAAIFGKSNRYITFCRSIYRKENTEGILVFNLNYNMFEEYLLNGDNSIAGITVKNENGTELCSYIKEEYGNEPALVKTEQNGDEFTVLTENYVSFVDEQYRFYKNLIILMIFIIVFGSAGIAYYLSYHNYKQLTGVIRILQDEAVGTEDKKQRDDEYMFITNNILGIMRQKNNIEEEFAEKVKILRKTQINALQSQINPHFIFNTMNLICMEDMVENKRQTVITQIVTLLSEILRAVLNTDSYMIPLEQELIYINKYIKLQNIKYDNRFTLVTNIDEDVLNLQVIKFMLQPIVENSIIHGILKSESSESGKIEIGAERKDKSLIITVSDDGIGMTEEKAEEIRNRLSQYERFDKRHIGIGNVNQRIKLICGEEYGVRLCSYKNGTVIKIEMPVL